MYAERCRLPVAEVGCRAFLMLAPRAGWAEVSLMIDSGHGCGGIEGKLAPTRRRHFTAAAAAAAAAGR